MNFVVLYKYRKKRYLEEEQIMNTNNIKKIILILVVATLLTIGLTGCGGGIIIISTTGTVVVRASVQGIYDIYIDDIWQGKTNAYGQLTITNVPGGNHYFFADGEPYGWYDSWWYWNYYEGDISQTTYNGMTNHVIIPVNLYYNY